VLWQHAQRATLLPAAAISVASCPAGMVLGTRPGAADESVALTSETSVQVPHELPGQDPEGGSEVNFAVDDESSSAAATPRGDLSSTFSERVSLDGQPASPHAQVPALGAGPPAGAEATPAGVRWMPGEGAAEGQSAVGLGGSWQDLQQLRQQSTRTNPLQFTEVRPAACLLTQRACLLCSREQGCARQGGVL
jgi:hypothetical protein